jgi:protein subunit release factor A
MAPRATNKIRTATGSDLTSLSGLYSSEDELSAVLNVPVSEALDKYTILLLKRDALTALLKTADDDDKGPLKTKLANIKKQLIACERVYKQVKAHLRPANKAEALKKFDNQFKELKAANKQLWDNEEQYLSWYQQYLKRPLPSFEKEHLADLAIEIRAGNLARSTAKYAIDSILGSVGFSETKVFKAAKPLV